MMYQLSTVYTWGINMNILTFLLSVTLPIGTSVTPTPTFAIPETVQANYSVAPTGRQTYTYVRCWYRTSHSTDDPATDWQWATNNDGSYFTLQGYWWSSVGLKNMFYTQTSQNTIRQRCEHTLSINHDNADITFYAADNRFSLNHTIWSNDPVMQANQINKIVAFGDSLSDTGNIFNAAQWRFPNPNSWFLGHFSNGLVWTEYLAQSKNMPVYNWAVGGAAGANQYVALTGVTGQVDSYLQYMGKAQNYRPENTLYTLVFGLNDFMNYNRDVAEVEADFTTALQRLTQSGAQNILMMTLPDVTKAPQFTYATPAEIDLIQGKINALNTKLKQLAAQYILQGYAIHLFDTHALFDSMVAEPEKHGFTNASEPCLNLTRSSAADYLYRHPITNTCARDGADKFVFWDVTHPTTATHRYISQTLLAPGNGLQYFNF